MLLITLFLFCVVSCLKLNNKGWRPRLDGGFKRQQNEVSSPQLRTRDVNIIPNDCQERGDSGLYGSYNIPLIPVPPILSQPSIQRPSYYSKKRSCDLSKTHHSFGLPTIVYHYHQSQVPRSQSRDKPDELNILKKPDILYSKKDNPYYVRIPSQPLPFSSIIYHGRAHISNEVYENNRVSSSLNRVPARPHHNFILNGGPPSERNPGTNMFPFLNKNILDEREENLKFHNVNYGDKTAPPTYSAVQSFLDKTHSPMVRNVSNFNPPLVSTIPNPGYNPNSRRKVHIFNLCGHSPWNIMKGPNDHLESGLHEKIFCNNHATQNTNFENIANPNAFPSQNFPKNPMETKISEMQGVISELEVVTTWRPDSLNNFQGRGIVNVVALGGEAKNVVPFDSGIIVNIPENNVLTSETSQRPNNAILRTAFIARNVEDSKDERVQDLIQDLYSVNLKRMANMLFKLNQKKDVKLPKPITVFAPSNVAFRNLPLAVSTQMENDVDFLEEVLLYHIVPGHFGISSLNRSHSVSSLRGPPLLFALGNSDDEKVWLE
ncbi:hypothetical protein QYM36_013133 [Artemia franciscana]|uniref:FAS1 domain-containing protein n=1 Tax=Artemia franciscana TaxID=6661 RepID=A0AA88KW18_ARTSF|nr:hypothetical protein QYM36_013133 [Artemia franciscana]